MNKFGGYIVRYFLPISYSIKTGFLHLAKQIAIHHQNPDTFHQLQEGNGSLFHRA